MKSPRFPCIIVKEDLRGFKTYRENVALNFITNVGTQVKSFLTLLLSVGLS